MRIKGKQWSMCSWTIHFPIPNMTFSASVKVQWPKWAQSRPPNPFTRTCSCRLLYWVPSEIQGSPQMSCRHWVLQGSETVKRNVHAGVSPLSTVGWAPQALGMAGAVLAAWTESNCAFSTRAFVVRHKRHLRGENGPSLSRSTRWPFL